MKCSTEASTGVLFSDLRYVDSPGACIVAPCMVGICAKAKAQAKVARFQTGYRGYVGWWGCRGLMTLVVAGQVRGGVFWPVGGCAAGPKHWRRGYGDVGAAWEWNCMSKRWSWQSMSRN
ncbi:hypothetical protein IG631_19282 [Alternaria alternata]|nr:hypothetical protein IG631_19282 [Alternaria alternata]